METYGRWKQGQAVEGEHKDTLWACRDGVGKARTHLELNLVREIKSNNERLLQVPQKHREYWEDGTWLLPVVTSEWTGGNGLEVRWKRFHLKRTKYLFTVSVVKSWNRLSREAAESPPVEMFWFQLDAVLGKLLWVSLLWAAWVGRYLQRSLPATWTLGLFELWMLNDFFFHWCVEEVL